MRLFTLKFQGHMKTRQTSLNANTLKNRHGAIRILVATFI